MMSRSSDRFFLLLLLLLLVFEDGHQRYSILLCRRPVACQENFSTSNQLVEEGGEKSDGMHPNAKRLR